MSVPQRRRDQAIHEQHTRRAFLTTTGGAALLAVVGTSDLWPASAVPYPPKPPGTTITVFDPTRQMIRHLRQWVFDDAGRGAGLLAASSSSGQHGYRLQNTQRKRALQWQLRAASVQLGWTPDATSAEKHEVGRWSFARLSPGAGPVAYGEPLGLGFGTLPSYVHHQHRSVGVDLGWSPYPVLEWQVLGGRIGTPVRSGDPVALYNQVVGDCLTQADRAPGADVGWAGGETWTNQSGGTVTDAMRAHWKDALVSLLDL